MSAEFKITMKLLIDKKNKRVLFAEAGKQSVDFFFHVLQLPVARVVTYLTTEAMFGSLGSLYSSLKNLSNDYMQPNLRKDILFLPRESSGVSAPFPFSTFLRAEPQYNLYRCVADKDFKSAGAHYLTCYLSYASDGPAASCPGCGRKMSSATKYVAPPGVRAYAPNEEGYVKGPAMYMILDDLTVKPMSSLGSIELLSKLNIKDVGCLEHREVALDKNKGLALLKASFTSKTVLTDVFLHLKDNEV